VAKNNNEGSMLSVITLQLKTRPYEADVLDSRFRVCANMYNAMLGERLKAYEKMCAEPEYAEAKTITDDVKKHDGTKEAKARAKELRDSGDYKKALDAKKTFHADYGFSEFSFTSLVLKQREHFKDIIPSKMAAMSIAKPMWSAFDKLLFKDGKQCSFKKAEDFTSIASDGKSGLRVLDENDKTAKRLLPGNKYFLSYTSKKGKQLHIPIVIDKKDQYIMDMLDRDIHVVRIVRKKVRRKFVYSLQLTVDGAPAVKYDHDGNLLHPVGNGRIAVFTDEKFFTVANERGEITRFDIDFPASYDDEKEYLQQKMDESKRVSNPQNINPDGTFMKRKDVPGGRLEWNFSKTYKRYASTKADIDRRMRETRRIRSNVIASKILALGNDISINDRPFKTNVGGGTYKDAITRNTPAQIITTLENKMKAAGLGELHRYKLPVEQEDKKKDGYRDEYAKELLHIRLQDLGEAK